MKFEFSQKADYQEYFGRARIMVRRSVKEFVDKEIFPSLSFTIDLFRETLLLQNFI